jgi:hypothetical protein
MVAQATGWRSSPGGEERRRRLVELIRASVCMRGSETGGEVELRGSMVGH